MSIYADYTPSQDDPRKIDQSKPVVNVYDKETALAVAKEAVYYNFTLKDFAEHINVKEHLAGFDARDNRIPLRRSTAMKFFDPRWEFETVGVHPALGRIVLNPRFSTPGGAATKDIPLRYLPDWAEIPLAALALAQYRLGFVPDDIYLSDSIAFRDGDTSNLRPENLVYTGRVLVKATQRKIRLTYAELEPRPYRVRCARCRYRLPREQEPDGWANTEFLALVYADQDSKEHRGVTFKNNGILCPVCQKFTHRVWNRSLA